MGRILLVGSLFLVACSSTDDHGPDGPDAAAQPQALPALDQNGCNAALAIMGDPTNPSYEVVGPYIFGQGRICVHLDLRAMRRAFFSVRTDVVPGTATNISLHVDTPDGAVLIPGVDVTVGQSDQQTVNEAARGLDSGGELDLVAVVGADNIATALRIDLLDPLD